MGIVINKLDFVNYRQYGTGSLQFNTSNEGMLSVIIAQNGTGKTTILNAITWCLYGQELHLADEKKALPVVTSAVVKEATIGDLIPVEVALTIADGENTVEFKRKGSFKIVKDASKTNRAIPSPDQLVVTITQIGAFKNTEIKTDTDAEILVKQYFDKDIFKFYFFDGEKLRDFFTASQTNSIQKSIFNISQITLLENACSHLYKMNCERNKKLAKDSPDIAKLNAEQEEQEKAKISAITTRDENRQRIDKLSKEREKLENVLREYEPVKKLQNERDVLNATLLKLEGEEKAFREARTAFIRKYEVLLTLYPRIKQTLKIIKEKELAGDLPPAIDKDLLKKLLDHPDQRCPICDSSIDETALEHMQKLLEQFSVSSQTSNYLKEIKGSLEVACDEAKNFKQNLEDLKQKEIDIVSRKTSTKKRLTEINGILSNFESDSDQVNVSALESKLSNLIYQISNAHQAFGAAKVTIQNCENELRAIAVKRNDAIKKMNEHEDIRKQIDVIEMLYRHFKHIKDSIIDDMKREIEKTTWEFFDRMIWKKNTFGKITISDNYDVSVFNRDNVEMTGSLSATEQMALAYAFTLAIHKASGKNCPLVIDSPLGRVSDLNRENMAVALKEVSKTKQIIMLFTPDEYSEEVRRIYDGTAVVTKLTLSEDENYVEGIER